MITGVNLVVEKSYPQILIVTPARNEALNLPLLANSLSRQMFRPITAWIVVDDGSTDGSAAIVKDLKLPFKVQVVRRDLRGKLITGAAFSAWWQGIEFGLDAYPSVTHVMKLDADVELDSNYFDEIFKNVDSNRVGVVGGVISGSGREQKSYVPGPVKMYSRDALDLLRDLPVATGFDVMDELFCREQGVEIQIIPTAKFRMNRQIGHSQGLVHGRFRNGLVCKWTGYAPEYFFLHFLRYLFRKPYVIGSIAMLMGYIFADLGPYPDDLRRSHSLIQRRKLKSLIGHPIKTIRNLYY